MVSVTHLTKKLMERKPFLQECLSKGLVNVFALAEHLQPEVEAELKQKVKTSAVMMALRRLAERLEERKLTKLELVEPIDFLIKSDVVEITIRNQNQELILPKVYSLINFKKGDFITITQGINQTTLTTNKKNKNKLVKLLEKNIVRTLEDLSLISIRMPEEYLETEGIIYQVTRELAWHKINIIEVISTLTEFSVVVKDEDIPLTYKILKELFK